MPSGFFKTERSFSERAELRLAPVKAFFPKIESCPAVIPVGIPSSWHFAHLYRENFFTPVNSCRIEARFP